MIDHLSDPGSWAETLALFPHPYLKVSDHLSRDDTKGNGTAEPVVAQLTVREVMPPCLSLPGGAFDHVNHAGEVSRAR